MGSLYTRDLTLTDLPRHFIPPCLFSAHTRTYLTIPFCTEVCIQEMCKAQNRHLICVFQAQADALDYHTSSNWTINVSTSTVSPKLKLSALRRDSIIRSRVNALKLRYLVELHCGDNPFKVKKNTEEGEESVLLALVSSEAKNDILQFAEKEFASEPLKGAPWEQIL